MKTLMLTMAAAVALTAMPLLAENKDGKAATQPVTTKPAATQPANNPPAAVSKEMIGAINELAGAKDASAAIGAFAKGLAVDPRSASLYEAYARKMIEFNTPDLAYSQAQTLVKLDPNNGLGHGVLAYKAQKDGNYGLALMDLAPAVQYAPNEVFIQKLAGGLVGWYNTQGQSAKLPDDVRGSVAKVDAAIGKTLAFANAYNLATVACRRATVNAKELSSTTGAQAAAVPTRRYVQQPSYSTVAAPYMPPQYQPSPVAQYVPMNTNAFYGGYLYGSAGVGTRTVGGDRGEGGDD